MFEYLEEYPSVVVAGSGRSGTHICADMIASDLGYRYVAELEFGQNKWGLFRGFLERGHVVCQAPDLWRRMDEIENSIAVVVVERRLEDIYRSWRERASRMPPDKPEEIYNSLCALRPLANVYWIHYEHLSDHPLWLPREVRGENWGWSQTRLPRAA